MGFTAKKLWFGSQQRQDVNCFCTVSVVAVGTIPVHWAPEALPTSKVARLCSVLVTADRRLVPRLRISGAIPPPPICLHGMHRESFTLTFIPRQMPGFISSEAMTASFQIPCRSLFTTVPFDNRLRCWRYCYINRTIESTFRSSFIKSWSELLSLENVLPVRVETFLLFFNMPCWDEERSVASCLVCYWHVSVCQKPTQYGAKHKNILPLTSPFPSDIANGGTLSNINRHFDPSVTLH